MKILIACEESQEICKAFRERGHEAFSCDLQPCSGGHPEWHIQEDVRKVMNNSFHLMVAHPVCKIMANSGVRWLVKDNKRINPDRWDELELAIDFFNVFANSTIWMKSLENPVQHKYARDGFVNRHGRFVQGVGKWSQTIQPYQHGHMQTKRTCLWNYRLPYLQETNNVYAEMMKLPYKERALVHYCPPGPEREKLRSKTFTGIAHAMAAQWG